MYSLASIVVSSMAVAMAAAGGDEVAAAARPSIPAAEQCPDEDPGFNPSFMLQTATRMLTATGGPDTAILGMPVLMGASSGADALLEDDWVVVMREEAVVQGRVHQICEAAPNCTGEADALGLVRLHSTWAELEGFVATNRADISYVEVDGDVHGVPDFPRHVDSRALPAGLGAKSWGLDRIDARSGLDGTYTPSAPGGGAGVHVYVLDTGIRETHRDFGGRAVPTLECLTNAQHFAGRATCVECSSGTPGCARDVHGHGTHCAATIGGRYLGVAKNAILHGVKTLGDDNSGRLFWSVAALDWIVLNGERPALVSASLGGGRGYKAHYVEGAVQRVFDSGIVMVVSAGNEDADACHFFFGYIPTVINVGATQRGDAMAGFSNYGSCISIFAPGVDVVSAGHGEDRETAVMSGTSMACPHVSGAVALLLGDEPTLSPGDVRHRIISGASKDRVLDPRGSPNEFLYVPGGPPPNLPVVSYWTEWGSTNFNGVARPAIACDHPSGMGSAFGFESRSWLGLVGAKLRCADGTILRTGSNRRTNSNWGYCNDNAPEWMSETESEWLKVNYQSRFGLVNAACGKDELGHVGEWLFDSNFNGRWRHMLRCAEPTDWFDGIQVREQWGYGLVNLRVRCSGYRRTPPI